MEVNSPSQGGKPQHGAFLGQRDVRDCSLVKAKGCWVFMCIWGRSLSGYSHSCRGLLFLPTLPSLLMSTKTPFTQSHGKLSIYYSVVVTIVYGFYFRWLEQKRRKWRSRALLWDNLLCGQCSWPTHVIYSSTKSCIAFVCFCARANEVTRRFFTQYSRL
jgi:hypothetical protein